jgi:hypothetical protein
MLAASQVVDRGVIATASEMLEARHFPGVVAMCSDALDDEPECVPLLLIRAQARIGLRRDLDAQADLRDVIRLDPRSSLAYRLLGELAARRDENASAGVFFREALRLDPRDREACDWLAIVDPSYRPAASRPRSPSSRPAAGASQLPATVSAAGHFSPRRTPTPGPVRAALGTQPPDHVDGSDERPTRPFNRVDRPASNRPSQPAARPRHAPTPAAASVERPTLAGRPAPQSPAKAAPRLTPRATPELPGFGEYLVSTGILTRERLRAAQAYQRSMRIQLATAIITLGLASPQRIQWAAVAHQSQLASER